MNRLINLAAWLTAVIFGASGSLASSGNGKIVSFSMRSSDGLSVVIINGSITSKPSCAAHDYFIIKDENSRVGEVQIAQVMTAQASGRSVYIEGTGSCTRWPDGEDVLFISLD